MLKKLIVSAFALTTLALSSTNLSASNTTKLFKQQGVASWYGGQFHGRTTASGEKFNMHSLTAAHRTLPLGTLVMVTNKANGKTVTVKINDRGPYSGNRVIDLSKAAAKELNMVSSGVANVKIERIF